MFRELDVGQSALLTDLAMCINYYRLFTPGLYCCVHATIELDDDTRICLGVIVMVNHGRLKQCDPGPDYERFKGPPNFVLDVFPGNDMLDYDERRDCFERHGVIEYVAVRHTEPVEWIWNRQIEGRFTEIQSADDEIIMSTALPGLWIPTLALKRRDWWAVMGAIARGVSRVGHREFMDTIWHKDKFGVALTKSRLLARLVVDRDKRLGFRASSSKDVHKDIQFCRRRLVTRLLRIRTASPST